MSGVNSEGGLNSKEVLIVRVVLITIGLYSKHTPFNKNHYNAYGMHFITMMYTNLECDTCNKYFFFKKKI